MPTILPNAASISKIQAAFLAFDTSYQQAYMEAKPKWSSYAMEMPSSAEEEVYAWMAKTAELEEWIGPRTVQNLKGRVQTLRNKKFQHATKVERVRIEDDRIGIYLPWMAEAGKRAALWPDKITTAAILAGESTTTYDGQFFFDTDHPVDMDDPASAIQANLKAAFPLTADNLAQARSEFIQFKGEDGVPMEIEPDTLFVPPQLLYKARQLTGAEVLGVAVGGAAAGQTNVLKGLFNVVELPRLAGEPLNWYLAHTGSRIKPFLFQNRMAPELTFLNNPTDPNVFWDDEYVVGVRARGAAGYGPWFLAMKCKG